MLSRIYLGTVYSGLFLQPFVFNELSRVGFVHRWIEIAVLVGLAVFFTRPKKQPIFLPLVILSVLLLLVAILSSIINGNWGQSLWGNYWRGDGLITLVHFQALALILILVPPRPEKIMAAIGAGSLLLSVWVLIGNFRLLVLHQSVANWQGVVGAGFIQPVFLAGYLAVTLPAVAGWRRLAPAAAIILTRAWGGYLGLAVFLAGGKARLAGIIIMLLMALGLVWRVADYRQSGRWAKNSEARERIVTKGLLAWREKPLFGWGWASFGAAFAAVDWPEKYLVDVYVDKAHSSLLEALVTTGAVGLAVYLAIIIVMLRRLSGAYLLMLVIWLVHTQTNVISVSEELLFWILLGVGHERT